MTDKKKKIRIVRPADTENRDDKPRQIRPPAPDSAINRVVSTKRPPPLPKPRKNEKPGPGKTSKLSWKKSSSIVPRETIAGNALTLVIGIMSFLVCVTFGAVSLVADTALSWQNDIAREVTIQIRPLDGVDMQQALVKAKEIASNRPGIASVSIIGEEETARLLEPWLGTGLSLDDLPVPRLLSVKLETGKRPDFEDLRRQLTAEIPGASLDDHQAWTSRLTTMAGATIVIGVSIMVLVMSATVLTVIFATRGAMSGNRHVVEVLHFVGAEDKYIADQFQRHFLLLGLKGGSIGGAMAILFFLVIGYWTGQNSATPGGDQVTALFGTFSVGLTGYAGIVVIVIFVAFLTAATSRLTVFRHIGTLERN